MKTSRRQIYTHRRKMGCWA